MDFPGGGTNSPSLLWPVVHCSSPEQSVDMALRAYRHARADGVFLVGHRMAIGTDPLPNLRECVRAVKLHAPPELTVGANPVSLGTNPYRAAEWL
eukprot:CAMPEP_0119139358 /NCGR_PEP_ID=MMETSP1310-20130426/27339_1 /TAXON_ID=464262 /ORGANISM="Genus nov. species nov., Strain RCC2339" /LENGTH=94 /DNA_ID=CAMNT_0007130641 /DNA_START=208 /DNA_END=489 /DNA_ORIENTATION=-